MEEMRVKLEEDLLIRGKEEQEETLMNRKLGQAKEALFLQQAECGQSQREQDKLN